MQSELAIVICCENTTINLGQFLRNLRQKLSQKWKGLDITKFVRRPYELDSTGTREMVWRRANLSHINERFVQLWIEGGDILGSVVIVNR